VEDFDPLAQTGWLHDHLEYPNLRVVDVRGYVRKTDLGDGRQRAEYLPAREEYDESHVPGAVFVDWTCDITDPDNPVLVQVAPPDRFAGLMASLGIGDDTHVVVIDKRADAFYKYPPGDHARRIVGLGFDPVWFGILIVVVVQIGLISPPVGMNMFVVKNMLPGISTGTIFRGVTPFVVAEIVLLAILLAFPEISLWLPRLLKL